MRASFRGVGAEGGDGTTLGVPRIGRLELPDGAQGVLRASLWDTVTRGSYQVAKAIGGTL